MGIDKLISKMPCETVLKKMDSVLFRPIAHACECVIDDMKSKEAESDDMMNVSELLGQIARLEEEMQALREECTSQEHDLEEANGLLEEVCPDTADLKAACEENPQFSFVQSDSGCEAICYYASTDLTDYAGAEEVCSAAGGSLVTMDTMTKNALMTDTVRKNFPTSSFWIGLTFDDGEWKWQGSEPVTYTDWANGEPDSKQYCASLNKAAQHRWFDWKCTTADKNGALCELNIQDDFEED
ncbi:C-type lectin lectoxin-Lio2-like isoform X2 [Gigantopelta aegis]|nr:C-type lectin lectoxin-Lio2-like isoform X2 [Gigantopelta aegis]